MTKVPRDGAATIGKTQSFSIGATPASVESDAFVMPTGLASNRTWGERPAPVESGEAAARLQAWLDADDATHFGQHEKDIETVLLALATSGEVTEAMIEAGLKARAMSPISAEHPSTIKAIYLAMCAAQVGEKNA